MAPASKTVAVSGRMSCLAVNSDFYKGLRFSASLMLVMALILNVLFSNSTIAHAHSALTASNVVIAKPVVKAPSGLAGQFGRSHLQHTKTSSAETDTVQKKSLNNPADIMAKLGYHSVNHFDLVPFYPMPRIVEISTVMPSWGDPFGLADAPPGLSSSIFHPPKT
jgi:hypothetical protein